MKVLALVPYPIGKGPSQRFRLEVFLAYLDKDISFDLAPFYLDRAYATLYEKGHFWTKASTIFKGYFNRYAILFKLRKYDAVYIQREAAPLGYPMIPWLIKHVFRKRIIYDFDDAIWMPNYSIQNAMFHRLKYYRKTKLLIKWSTTCSAGNQFLFDYASQFSDNVVLLPTVVDTSTYHNPGLSKGHEGKGKLPVIGWTGTHSTLKYLEVLMPLFEAISKERKFELLVISNKPPLQSYPFLRFIEWSKEHEIEDLLRIDLGIMPLFTNGDDAFALGKCGFKIIQYQALEIPAVASFIGVNNLIISEGVNGFFCDSEIEWKSRILDFLDHPDKYREVGLKGRENIINNYSVESRLSTFKELFIDSSS